MPDTFPPCYGSYRALEVSHVNFRRDFLACIRYWSTIALGVYFPFFRVACMSYIKTMTQQKLSFFLALYIGLFMNSAVFYRRFDGYAQAFTVLERTLCGC